MTEAERQLIEAQQSCKRVTCPHCAGRGQMTVANGPFVQEQVGFGLTSIGGLYGRTISGCSAIPLLKHK